MMSNENTMAAGNNQKVTNAFDKAGDKKKKALVGVLIAAFYWIPAILIDILLGKINPNLGSNVFFIIMIASSITAYTLTGGLDMVFGIAKKIAFFGWIILPFPIDIVTGIATFLLALFLFAAFPIVFAVICWLRIQKETKSIMI
ncbi:hypothetical protein [Butyrivibrio fibrisolvens]|uniref:hypothetical protein n=1 Tax=Butyrivibrio fibrisolvens TaxID=831 RepID=UPI0004241C1D|nr:hypothetical protein [Butyrivibrio fibrisolvens]